MRRHDDMANETGDAPRPAGRPGRNLAGAYRAAAAGHPGAGDLLALQNAGGNASVGRVLAQRSASPGEAPVTRYRSENPLAPYVAFKASCPGAYAALDATAKQYAWRPDAAEPVLGTGWRTRTEVPVVALLRPALPPVGALAPLRDRLWPLLAAGEQDPKSIAAVVMDEVVSRWSARNDGILGAEVTVRLLLPNEVRTPMSLDGSGLIRMEPDSVLEFSIGGRPIPTADGSIDVVTLDLLGSNDLETAVGEVSAEVAIMAQAADFVRATTTLAEAEGRYWDDVGHNPDAFALNDVSQHFELLWDGLVLTMNGPPPSSWPMHMREFLASHPEYAAELAPSLDTVNALSTRALPIYEAHYARHDVSSEPLTGLDHMRHSQKDLLKTAGERWDEGGDLAFVAVCDRMGWGLGEAILGLVNLVTGGGVEAGYQADQAYRRGEISKAQLDELEAAIAGRGIVSAIVFSALTLATAGLAGPVLGASAGLARTILFAGASEALTTAATMTTTSIYTRQQEFADPTAQNIWGQGAYSPGQIAFGSLTAGLGGALIPVAGMALTKFVSWIRATRAARSALPPPAGWVREEIGPGTARYTNPDVPGEVVETPSSFRYQASEGSGMRVESDLPHPPGGPFGPDDIDLTLGPGFQPEALGPMVGTPVGSNVMDVGSGRLPANLGLGDGPVQIIRADVNPKFNPDRVLNAQGPLPDDLVDSLQAVIINNPFGYRPNMAELGRAVRPGGKIIIQGNPANRDFRRLIDQGPPRGFVTSVDEAFDAAVALPAGTRPDAPAVRRNIMGGPFQQTRGGEAHPTVRVVYEKPIEGPENLGARLGAESRGKPSRFNHVAGALNRLQLGQRNAAQAAVAATREIVPNHWTTRSGNDVIIASSMTGAKKPILVVKPDGTVVRAAADISITQPLDPANPLTLSNIVEDPPILPGR